MAPPPRLRILSGEFLTWHLHHSNLQISNQYGSDNALCSGRECDLSLSIMAAAGNNILRRYSCLEIGV